jgi:hypothetical protein
VYAIAATRVRTSFQFKAEFENISADRVFQAHGAVGSFDLAGVSWVLKMVQQLGRVHMAIVMRSRPIAAPRHFRAGA